MRKAFTLILISLFFFACKQQEKDINTDEDIETTDFILAFPEKQLPIQFNSKDINQKESDSFYIKSSVVSKFIPDSVFRPDFKQLKKVKFYRKARYKAEETNETYLFLSAEEKNNKKVYLVCYNENNEFAAAMKLIEKTNEAGLTMEGGIDKRLTIIKTKYKESPDKKSYYEKSAFVYNTEGLFTLILTDSNLPLEKGNIYNPIDTLSKKDPLSGDYKIDETNFVSIRDGAKTGKLQFFINIEKSGGKCSGTLRGDLVQVKPKVFHYSKADDHCVLEFSFSGKRLQVRELEACGNHRGIRCSFDGKFNKK
ncbi:MAG: hypothetical protein RJB42_328 [Bacteroidota bacterium]